MRLHFIGTINGQTNEGMRNVATHLFEEAQKIHIVQSSLLKDIPSVILKSIRSDACIIVAKANQSVYWLIRILQVLCRNIWVVLVQRPDSAYIKLNDANQLKCNYFYINKADLNGVTLSNTKKTVQIPVGINISKFKPVSTSKSIDLKKKYSIPSDKPLIVHVGHCSSGRGLEDFCVFQKNTAERLVVVSGMFEDYSIVQKLKKNHVRIISGYVENIEEIYQMADIYLFPTQSTRYVISIPLSVMEALACGTPVMAYNTFDNIRQIKCEEGSITWISSSDEIAVQLNRVAAKKATHSLLVNPASWDIVAKTVFEEIENHSK